MPDLTRYALIITLFAALSLLAQDADPVSRAKTVFARRHRNPALMDSSARILESYLGKNPGDIHARILLSEVYLKQGDLEKKAGRKIELFTKGEEQARQALLLDSMNGAAQLWATSNLALIYKTKGFMGALHVIPVLRNGISRALRLDTSCAKCWNAQGQIFAELPGFVGGNLDSAEYYLRKGLPIDTNYPNIRVILADVLIRKRKYKEAGELLRQVLSMKTPSDEADYVMVNRPRAEKMLAKISGR
jgi:tetratricopeptide (TPR) repeat protein